MRDLIIKPVILQPSISFSKISSTIMKFTDLSPQEVLDLGKPLHELEELVKGREHPQFDFSDASKTLALMRHMVSQEEQADEVDPTITEITINVESRDGVLLPLKTFRRAKGDQKTAAERSVSPLIVLYFPGGFIFGSPTLMAGLARLLVKKFNAVVVAPTYRLAPEHPFPTWYNDGWDVFQWIAQNASGSLRANPGKGFVVGGISSGANVANVVAHLARDNSLHPSLTGVWLSCGGMRLASQYTDRLPPKYRERYLSRTQEECVNSGVSSEAMSRFVRRRCNEDPESVFFAPLIWSSGPSYGHAGYPRTYFQVCGMDPPRDEALIFDDMLKEAGVETRLDMYAGLPHVFWHSFKQLDQSKKWIQDTLDGFAWLLDGE
ncbi:hypothetical protein M409DRAFT_23999 [Zasmidium cellare ATCC 36951]|uniref:Alpha/beta hydrolase fold-3 domain-containing protein n=1 Tax=Zasmidium cellare ATCC 36951 TaxID=1080233 RepID=A0A6A6CJ33_ZASCE|nr:uncharacterized protein M409DRAFT_23999 [Zasmidium cellare ATCC 36951]KAF2165709.1 hypothetical protein M409DRAFT_23999 [Zasmidium cellare ATCC 36951]